MNEPGNSNGTRRPLANIVIAAVIVVALACLIIPAIVTTRVNTRQMQCAYNIRQIALGLCNYGNIHKQFPTGTLRNEQLTLESRLSWYVGAWQFVGDGQAELLLDRQEGWNDPDNLISRIKFQEYNDQGVEDKDITVDYSPSFFRCPDLEPAIRFGNLVQTAYVGPSGVGQESLISKETRPHDGIWGYDRSTAIDQICDSLDKTLLLLETSVKNGPWTAGRPPTVREIEETDLPAFGIGRQFGGLHAGITNVAFADGSAKPLNDDIDMTVLVELVRVCDAEE
jgi:prepilin-type processing-associated H-X9-DG protein